MHYCGVSFLEKRAARISASVAEQQLSETLDLSQHQSTPDKLLSFF